VLLNTSPSLSALSHGTVARTEIRGDRRTILAENDMGLEVPCPDPTRYQQVLLAEGPGPVQSQLQKCGREAMESWLQRSGAGY